MKELLPYSVLAELERCEQPERPPVDSWHPSRVVDIDLEIRADGSWYYEGTPINRQRLVRLFAGVLRREADGEYYLVTPIEKSRIRVARAPFVALLMDVHGEGEQQRLEFTTNVADKVTADADHPIVFESMSGSDPGSGDGEPLPFVEVRDGLQALLGRSVYYQLMDLAEKREVAGEAWYGVWSGGCFFKLLPAAAVEATG